MRVAFRTDSSERVGIGHLMRSLALAGDLAAEAAELTFYGRDLPGARPDLVVAAGFAAVGLEDAGLLEPEGAADRSVQMRDAEEFLAGGARGADLVVVDHYGLDATWESTVARECGSVLVLDDLADRAHACDFLIDQNLTTDRDRYQGCVSRACRMFLGPRFALLRAEMIRARARFVPRDGRVRRVLVSFGGTDPTNETPKVLDALAHACPGAAVDVVTSVGNPRLEEIRHESSVRGHALHVDTHRMADLMLAADLSVGASGSTSWERCWLGLPAIVASVAPNQVPAAAALGEAKAAVYLGPAADVTAEMWADALAALASDPTALRTMGARALEVTGPESRREYHAMLAEIRRAAT